MKVQELIEFVNKNKYKMMPADQTQQIIAKTIEVKDYLGIKEKRALIEDIISECILYEDGVYKFDSIDKYIAFTMKTIAAYTNLELSADMDNDYDALCRAKLLNVVISTFNGEYENVNVLLQMQCESILSGNTIEAQFGKLLSNILGQVDNFSNSPADNTGDFDFANSNISIDDFGKLMEFVNSQKK